MLDQLDKIDWARLEHAYGPATDVPDCLWRLASADKEVRGDAMYDLYGNIWHQGTVYEATAHALPFLIELLGNESVSGKDEILIYLAHLATGNSYHDVHQHLSLFEKERAKPDFQQNVLRELTWVKAAREAVLLGYPVYLQLLPSPVPVVRSAAAYLLGSFPERANEGAGELLSHLESQERDDVVRAAIVFAIGMIASGNLSAMQSLERYCLDAASSAPVRIAAAIGLAGAVRTPLVCPAWA